MRSCSAPSSTAGKGRAWHPIGRSRRITGESRARRPPAGRERPRRPRPRRAVRAVAEDLQVASEPEAGEPVHERPTGDADAQGISLGEGVVSRAVQLAGGGALGGPYGGIVTAVKIGAEHHFEV